jgi:hypothetical protein
MATPSSSQQSSIPGTVIVACVLWIIYGAFGLLGGLSTISASKGTGATQLAIAAIFIISGIQVLMGKASGLMGTGIVCIVLAGLGLFAVYSINGAIDGRTMFPGWVMTIVMVNSGILMLSGILAIVGNTKYKEWRRSRGVG